MYKREKAEIAAIIILSIVASVAFVQNTAWTNSFKEVFANHESKIMSATNITPATPQIHQQLQIQKSDEDFTNARISLFDKVENSVVQITSKISTVNSHIIINGNPLEQQSTRLGSGFVYDDKGHILTNNHVVDGTKKVDVTFVDGNTYTAEVIGTDSYNDIAVLKIADDFSDEKLVPIQLGDSSHLKVGEQAIAIGNPFGLSDTMTTGIISQTGRLLANQDSKYSIPNVIQTDAAINPGNSGGPLLNIDGEVIGMNTAIQSNTGEFSGIGFAIPSNTIKRIVPTLIEKGSYDHPWLGVSGQTLNPDIAQSFNLPRNYKGVLVSTVVKDGPAEKAGLRDAMYNADHELKQGDVIISLDGNQVNGIDDVISYIADNKIVGDKVVVSVNRDGKTLDLTATLEKRPSS